MGADECDEYFGGITFDGSNLLFMSELGMAAPNSAYGNLQWSTIICTSIHVNDNGILQLMDPLSTTGIRWPIRSLYLVGWRERTWPFE